MFITNLIRAFGEWRRYRAAVRELAALDDRGLEDIGLNRGYCCHDSHHRDSDHRGCRIPGRAHR